LLSGDVSFTRFLQLSFLKVHLSGKAQEAVMMDVAGTLQGRRVDVACRPGCAFYFEAYRKQTLMYKYFPGKRVAVKRE